MNHNPAALNGSAPRYQQLSATLAREIREGRHAVGSLLPPEPQLCRRFGVSRHTLREAVRRLCEQGLVSRRQGIGTRVLASNGNTRFVAALGSLQDLMQYTQETRLEPLSDRWIRADAALATLLQCTEGERWLQITACRYSTGTDIPLVHMEIFVRPECEGLRTDLGDGSAWFFGLVEKHGGEKILEAQQVVGAVSIRASSARILGVKPGSPGLQVRRYYRGSHDRLLSMSLNVYPADRFELTTSWRLETPSGLPEPSP